MIDQIQDPNFKHPILNHRVLYTVIVVLLLVVIMGAYFWWQAIQFGTDNPGPAPTLRSGQSAVPADWKTYTNEQYGFELSLPPEYKKREIRQTIFIESHESPKAYLDFGLPVSVSFPSNLEALKLDNGIEVKKYGSGSVSTCCIVDMAYVYLEKENKYLLINYETKSDKSNTEFNQILSTFKFTNGISNQDSPQRIPCHSGEGWCYANVDPIK